MVQMLPETPGFGAKLGSALGGALGGTAGAYFGGKLKSKMDAPAYKQFEEKFGIDISKYPKEVREEFTKAFAKGTAQEKIMESILAKMKSKKEFEGGESNDAEGGEDSFAFAKALAGAGLKGPADIATKEAELEEKRKIKKEERGEARAEKYLDEARKSKTELFGQQASLKSAKQAVLEGKEGLSGDFWANALGLPELKSVSGATLDASAKIHLMTAISNLSGGRPNQFLEKQISQAFAMPGASKKANLAKLSILEAVADMKQLEVDKALEIADRFDESGKPVPGKLDRIALKEVTPQIEKRQKQLAYQLQEYLEPDKDDFEINKIDTVAKGTPLTQKKAEIIFKKVNPYSDIEHATEEELMKAEKMAKGLGYDINAYSNAFGE